MQDFNVALMEITKNVMPSVTGALKDFDGAIKHIKGVLPGGETKNDGSIGKRVIQGALGGVAYGALGGPGGMAIGVLGGGVIGGVEGVAEQYMRNNGVGVGIDKGGSYTSPGKTGKPAQPVEVHTPPQSFSLILDSEILARAMIPKIVSLFKFETGAPAMDGSLQFGP